jgi:hypothetical protein
MSAAGRFLPTSRFSLRLFAVAYGLCDFRFALLLTVLKSPLVSALKCLGKASIPGFVAGAPPNLSCSVIQNSKSLYFSVQCALLPT